MHGFAPATRAWFDSAFTAATAVQERGWQRIAAGEHTLLIAPTGSGKTLAAFLWCIDRLVAAPSPEPGVRVVYVSPLKALVYDIERNLEAPLRGIARAAGELGIDVTLPRVAVRTGDTTSAQRRSQARNPAEILVTTPESLYLILGSRARDTLRTVHTVIVDEVHALAPTKRGAHLALSLERLARLAAGDPQRIGLSATARPAGEVARFLGGDRPVTLVDTSAPPALDLQIVVPVDDMTRPQPPASSDADSDTGARARGMWPAIVPLLVDQIRSHRSTILFVNSRGLCERLTQQLNELAALEAEATEEATEELVRSHHGSLSHDERRRVEELLKSGRLPGIVATSSLELGIDMDAVDLVVMVESPGSVARGLQRIGRAGHGVGQVSKGRLYPKHRGDLLEATVVGACMARGDIEALHVPHNPLDVLAQQIVAAVAAEPRTVAELEATLCRAANFRDLPHDAYIAVLDMLAGRYPSTEFADLSPRIVWDRQTDALTPRRGAKMLAATSGGTIPDRGTYGVYLGEDGPRVGELDEEMVHETQAGDLFTLGASTWRVEDITRDRVIVSPAPGEAGKLPFWRGDGPGRPVELGRAMGAFVRQLDARLAHIKEMDEEMDAVRAWLADDYRLGPQAADNLIAYIAEQRRATGTVPTDRRITVERFRDELGDWRVCILSHAGARVHAPWALALQALLGARAGFEVQTLWSDDGLVVRFANTDALPEVDALIPDPDDVEELVIHELGRAALFAGQFRENAARALLIPRRRPGQRNPLWLQRIKSQQLLAAAREHPDFPIIIETYRACLRDIMDVPALIELCRAVERREVRVDAVETTAASPFARSLVFAYVAAYLYDGDAPLAERRAQALSLDRRLLRELLGQEELRELLDADVIAALEAELQALTDDRKAGHADAVHDLLRRLGDLTEAEVAARCAAQPAREERGEEGGAGVWLDELARSRRAVRVAMPGAGQERWIAIEDVALYRDALGVEVPAGVPDRLLAPVSRPMDSLLLRWSRTHGPYVAAQVAARYGLAPGHIDSLLAALCDRGELIEGGFHPHGAGREYCHPDILRRIKRRTLARLRDQVAPVEPARLGLFLPAWHQLTEPGRGLAHLQEVLIQLEGLPLPFSELERVILPARVSDFSPRMLDELGAMGWLVWIGHGALGSRDGRVALYRRDRVSLLYEPPAPDAGELGDVHRALLAHLEAHGASFFVALHSAVEPATTDDVMAALWDLVWAGYITNDTLQPLRAHARRTTSKPRGRAARSPRRGSRAASRTPFQAAGGRWSLVSQLVGAAPSATERAHARAAKLLERHGIVSREVADLEPMPGGFSAMYQVLRAMEEAGKVRRGYFVEGLGGAQFAMPGAVDRLRAEAPEAGSEPRVDVLSAVDPASPYGWLVPWPGDSAPRRVAGASVVLVAGEPVLYVDKGGRRLLTFPAAADRDLVRRAARALDRVAATKRGKTLRIETIDGAPARTSELVEAFTAAGFFADPRGLVRELRLFDSA